MGFQSLRPLSPSRRRLATFLALMAPGLGLADDGGNSLRLKLPTSPSLRDDSSSVQVVDHTQLVPLPDELIGPHAGDMMIFDPQARGGGGAGMVPIARFDTEDGWMPRSPHHASPILNSPLMNGPLMNGPMVRQPATGRQEESVGRGQPASGRLRLRIGDSSSSTLQILDFPMRSRVGDVSPETSGNVSELEGPVSVASGASGDQQIASDLDDSDLDDSDSAGDQVSDPEQNEPAARVATRNAVPTDGEGSVAFDAVNDSSEPGDESSVADQAEIDAEPFDDQWDIDEDSEDWLADDSVTEPSPDGGELSVEAEVGESESDESMEASLSPSNVAETSTERTNDRGVEIRKLRLSEDVAKENENAPPGPKAASGNRSDKVIITPSSRSAGKSRATVGDVRLDELPAESEATPLGKRSKSETGSAKVADNPILGDRILESGELILASGKTAANLPLKAQTARLKPLIEKGLRYYWDRPEDAAERTHWGMMHSIMVFDRDTQIISRRQRYNAVAWMAGNNPCRNQLFFDRDQHGIVVRTGVGLQGHQAQLLAVFGLIDVPSNYPVYAAKQKFTVADILEREKRDCKVNAELTFTLIGLAHYADSDSSWVAADGQDWSVERVIREELAQPIVGAACGGTHRLMGFGHALRRRRAEEKPITGQWDRADRYLKDFVAYTWSLQNRDGSMSTAWYEKSEDNGNIDRKLQTTGHMLEFLMTVTPDAELQSPEMLRTVSFMANTLYNERGHEWQVGPKGHALRSLVMYYQRVYGNSSPWRIDSGARNASTSGRSVR